MDHERHCSPHRRCLPPPPLGANPVPAGLLLDMLALVQRMEAQGIESTHTVAFLLAVSHMLRQKEHHNKKMKSDVGERISEIWSNGWSPIGDKTRTGNLLRFDYSMKKGLGKQNITREKIAAIGSGTLFAMTILNRFSKDLEKEKLADRKIEDAICCARHNTFMRDECCGGSVVILKGTPKILWRVVKEIPMRKLHQMCDHTGKPYPKIMTQEKANEILERKGSPPNKLKR